MSLAIVKYMIYSNHAMPIGEFTPDDRKSLWDTLLLHNFRISLYDLRMNFDRNYPETLAWGTYFCNF